MMLLYRIGTAVLYTLAYLWGRGRAARGSALWQGRLGLIEDGGPVQLWLHASSVGEVRVLGCLLEYLFRRRPSGTVHLTAMTSAGFKTAHKLFGEQISVSYLPLDATPAVRRTLDKLTPAALIIAETEIWPTLVTEASRRAIPIILVNGRMSARAFRRYRLVAPLMRKLLARYARLFVKTEADADRFRIFGVDEENIVVAGDMKFDAPLRHRSPERVGQLRRRFGLKEASYLFVAGSTRPGEEEVLLAAFEAVASRCPDLCMILAPRHVNRTGELEALMQRWRLDYSILGNGKAERLVLVNRMGVLNDLYLASDIAFVGGTLVDIGGHNLLEPVWSGVPVMFGPYLANVREAADYVLDHAYGARVTNADELGELLRRCYHGEAAFKTKTEQELSQSATVAAGDFILKRSGHD